jgi:hypothetical protein
MSVKIGSSAPAPHATPATQGKKNPRTKEKDEQTEKTKEVATKTFPINNEGQPKPLKAALKKAKVEKEVEPYAYPLSNEPWAQKAKKVSTMEWIMFKGSVYTFVTPLLSKAPAAVTALKELNTDSITTYGKIEEFAVSILQLSMTCSEARKEQVHLLVQDALKHYSDTESLYEALPKFKAIASTPPVEEK